MTKKMISVLLPVYNAEKFLRRTLDSILNQTYENFEVIAINDGSSDESLTILEQYAKRDPRVVVIDQKNHGLVKTLNKAAEIAQGEYLARMDSDDLSLPRRFELQLKAFEENPNAVLVAGGFDVINEDDEFLYHDAVPTLPDDLKRALLVRNPIAHGSVMIKKAVFKTVGGYSEECGPTEDYELWSRVVHEGDIIAVGATVFRWRINPNGITHTKAKVMNDHMKINLANFRRSYIPEVISRAHLIERGNYYHSTYKQHGIGMKHTMLKDCTSVGMLFMRNKQYGKALKQFFAVASTGRTGLRIVRERFNDTSRYYIRVYANKSNSKQSTIDA